MLNCRTFLLLSFLVILTFGRFEAVETAKVPNIVLITMDTTRADHLRAYGYSKGVSPFIDSLAGQGALFEDAYTPVPITLPAHASLFTGLYPFRHGVRDNGLDKLSMEYTTLAEVLKKYGYSTSAFISASVLDRVFGLNQGFDLYDDNVRIGPLERFNHEQKTSEQLNQSIQKNLSRLKSPYFLWVHYFDPHSPYVPPDKWQKRFPDLAYDAEIAYMDSSIAALFDMLRSHKLLENTLTVLTADHGESLGEHQEEYHGVFLYRSTMHVPLIFHYPGKITPGTRVRGISRLIDILPTILDYADIQENLNMDGTSLRTAVQTGETPIQSVYSESYIPLNSYGWAPLFGLRNRNWSFILAPDKELYDLTKDANEMTNVFSQNTKHALDLQSKLQSYLSQPKRSEPIEISEELKEKLRSLGYVSQSAQQDSKKRLDPKLGVLFSLQIDEARELLGQGRVEQAAALLRKVLKQNPENVFGRASLGVCLLKQKKYAEAERELRMALAIANYDYVNVSLADSLALQGKMEEAGKYYRAAINTNSRNVEAYVSWVNFLIDKKDFGKAQTIADEGLSKEIQDPRLFYLRGLIEANAGQDNSAIKFYDSALNLDDEFADVFVEKGKCLYRLGKKTEAIQAYERASSLKPEDAALLKTLGALYLFERKDKTTALSYFRKALGLVSSDSTDAKELRELISNLQ